MATTAVSSVRGPTGDDAAFEAVQHFETVHKNYVAIINPNTGRAMLHLKKYGECTLIDPRACIRHYECAADVACILYATVSLPYFHYMVHCGYISNKTRVVLNDTYHDTFVFVVAENFDSREAAESHNVEDILSNLQRKGGGCSVGTDVLQAGTDTEIGYFFHQPTAYFRKRNKIQSVSHRVMTGKDWAKRLKAEKAAHDCQRRALQEQQKDSLGLLAGCRGGASARTAAAKAEPLGAAVLHVPVLIIQSAHFNIKPPQRT